MVGLMWYAPFYSGGGYCSEATAFVMSLASTLAQLSITQHGDGYNAAYVRGWPHAQTALLGALSSTRLKPASSVALCHSEPGAWVPSRWERTRCPPDNAAYAIGRTMFETDRLPEGWAARLNRMDEVWVPSRFNLETFAAGGVDRRRLVVVPEPVDTAFFDPDRAGVADDATRRALDAYAPELQRAGAGTFKFLSIFKWEERKGWNVLLRAFFDEFDASGGATLFLLTNPYHSAMSEADFRAEVAALRGATQNAHVVVLTPGLPQRLLPALYKACDAFVLPSRGEGWGRPHAEAMAMRLPLIATNWSGTTEFANEANSFPVRVEELVPVREGAFAGHMWAEPSLSHLREQMRAVVADRPHARAVAERARSDMVELYSPRVLAASVSAHLQRIGAVIDARGAAGREL